MRRASRTVPLVLTALAIALGGCKRLRAWRRDPAPPPPPITAVSPGVFFAGNVASFSITSKYIAWLERADPGRLFVREIASGAERVVATVAGTDHDRRFSSVTATSTHVLWYDKHALGPRNRWAAPLAGGPARSVDVGDAGTSFGLLPWTAGDGVLAERADGALVLLDSAGTERRTIVPPPSQAIAPRFWSVLPLKDRVCWGTTGNALVGATKEDAVIACAGLPEGETKVVRKGGILVAALDNPLRLSFQEAGRLYVLEGDNEREAKGGVWPMNAARHVSNGTHSCVAQGLTHLGPETVLCLRRDGTFEAVGGVASTYTALQLAEDVLYYVSDEGIRQQHLH